MADTGDPRQAAPHGIGTPGPTPVVLSSRQRAVFEGLVNLGPKEGPRQLGVIYQGVLARIADPTAPDCAALAAHGARELMEKLAWHANDETPEERGSLGDRAVEIEKAHKTAVDELPPERARWGEARLTQGLIRLIDVVAHMVKWQEDHTLGRGAYASIAVDFSLGRLPDHLRAEKRKEWISLRNFFTNVAHHRRHKGSEATLADVAERFTALDAFLYARWAPETVQDFAEIDTLIKPGEDS